MKTFLYGFFLFLFLSSSIYAGEPPRFLILCKASGDTAVKYGDAFETVMASYLKDAFACAIITKRSSIVAALERERIEQYLGEGSQQNILNLGKEMNFDYLVILTLKTFEKKQIFVRAVCVTRKDAKCMADANYILVSMDYQGVKDGINSISNTLVDLLCKHEICPFKGEINVKITSTKKDDQIEEYPVYCNGADGTYHKTITINNYSESDWTIKKIGRETANGIVQFNLSEELTIDEINPCYECSPTKQGQRTYYAKTTTYADIQKSTAGNSSSEIIVDSARVILNFLDDGTYTVRIKAASKLGTKKTIEEVKAQGICDNINEPPKKTTNKIDEGLCELLGPFTGTAEDKSLSNRDTIKRTDPVSGEEETITYEFNLTRD